MKNTPKNQDQNQDLLPLDFTVAYDPALQEVFLNIALYFEGEDRRERGLKAQILSRHDIAPHNFFKAQVALSIFKQELLAKIEARDAELKNRIIPFPRPE